MWAAAAYNDLQKICTYIRYFLKEENVSRIVAKKILDAIAGLNYFPERYSKIQSKNTLNLRKMFINNYVVIYEISHISRQSCYFTYFS